MASKSAPAPQPTSATSASSLEEYDQWIKRLMEEKEKVKAGKKPLPLAAGADSVKGKEKVDDAKSREQEREREREEKMAKRRDDEKAAAAASAKSLQVAMDSQAARLKEMELGRPAPDAQTPQLRSITGSPRPAGTTLPPVNIPPTGPVPGLPFDLRQWESGPKPTRKGLRSQNVAKPREDVKDDDSSPSDSPTSPTDPEGPPAQPAPAPVKAPGRLGGRPRGQGRNAPARGGLSNPPASSSRLALAFSAAVAPVDAPQDVVSPAAAPPSDAEMFYRPSPRPGAASPDVHLTEKTPPPHPGLSSPTPTPTPMPSGGPSAEPPHPHLASPTPTPTPTPAGGPSAEPPSQDKRKGKRPTYSSQWVCLPSQGLLCVDAYAFQRTSKKWRRHSSRRDE